MREAVLVAAVRTPIGKRGGMLADRHPVDLGADVLTDLLARVAVEPSTVDDVVWGCVSAVGEQSSNVARWSVLAAGWPDTIPGTTVDRACGSSQQALHFAAASVVSGQCDVVIAGGVESMSRVPIGSSRTVGPGEARGPRVAQRYDGAEFSQGVAAELVAARWSLSRQQLDEYSLESHARAARARDDGRFDAQLVALDDVPAADEGIRAGGTLDRLAQLAPAFADNGVVTAAGSSQISDGASAVLVTTPEKAAELGCRPLARLHSVAVTAVDPVLMLTGPISATARVLQRAGLSIDDIGAFEVNEAFAPVPLAWLAETGVDPKRLNPNGGAIALGHPLGCSGTRLTTTLLHHLIDEDLRYGLQAICEAGGMANALILEKL